MSAELTAPVLQDGDRLDIVNGDGIWNVAQVLRPPTPETVEARQRADCSLSHAHVDCQVLGEARFVTRWPALLTGRAFGSAQGSHNLRLARRLLVDFLDKVEFKERCRCWVKKSNATAYQSDEEARNMLTNLKKKKNKSKGEVRLKNLKNLAFSTELLSKCDAREDFPEFEEGTLCVQFKTNCTRPTAEVRKEMGEEVWKRGFADNRASHASTHASLPLLPDGSNSDSGNITEKTGSSPAKSGQTSHDRATSSSPGAGKDDASSVSKESKESKDVTVAPENPEIPTQKPVNFRKRARSHDEEGSFSSTDSCRAENPKAPRQEPQESQSTAAKETLSTDSDQTGKTKAPRKQPQENDSTTKKTQTSKADGNSAQAKRNQKPKPAAKEVHVSPRKYVKTPKVLKSQRTQSANLPPYTPPHTRLLPKANPGDEKNVTRANIPNQARDVPCAKTAAERGAALESKLTELAEKSAKAEELRNKYAALKIRCGIRGLELVLDDLLAKDLSHRLSATTTTAELDAIKAELLASPKVHFSDVLRLEQAGEEAFGLTPHFTIMNTVQQVSQPAPVVVVEHRIEGNLKPGMVIASMATDPHRLGFYF
ncbi:hypothetical protein PInf_020406 [Phytophthora infestans]|nr:hypothetical protein PInf_020406 [Phytophthora infestans]